MPTIRFRLNGVETSVDADPDSSLLSLLRGRLGLAGPHFGCGANECGACNVMIGDRAVAACDTPLWSVADKDITSLEGLGSEARPHPLQRASTRRFHILSLRSGRVPDDCPRPLSSSRIPEAFR